MTVVGGGQYILTGGWAYWPVSDVYQITPKWEEWHSVTGKVIHPNDETNRYALVANWEGTEPYIILTLTQDDPDTRVVEADVPTGVPSFRSSIAPSYGWSTSLPLLVEQVVEDDLDDEGDEVWTGKIKVNFTEAVRALLGYDRTGEFCIDMWFEETPDTRLRIAFGTLVFRR